MGYALRSTFIIGSMYGLVFLLVWLVGTYFAGWSIYLIAGVSLGFIFLQYLISPLILRWIYRIDWIDPERLRFEAPEIAQFLENTAKKYAINVPKFGIIHEGTPNAFCFGWSKNSARLVITDGIRQYLDKEEQVAVVGHEMGHIVHNDFIVMTFVSAIPVLFYTIFRILISTGNVRGNSETANKIQAAKTALAVLSWVMYIIGYLISLMISRIREYWADEFSAMETQNPNGLATGLVKIAYGILQTPTQQTQNRKAADKSQFVRALGIFDGRSAKQVAYSATNATGKVDTNIIAKAAAWDLYQPWAKYFEILSTHPLPAKRIKELQYIAYSKLKQTPAIDLSSAETEFHKQMGKSGFDEFLSEVFILIMPKLLFLTWIVIGIALYFTSFDFTRISILYINNPLGFLMVSFIVAGIFQLLQNLFKYSGNFAQHDIMDLVGTIKVSPIRPVPTITRGRVVGRGMPGLFYSEDVVIQDNSGIMYIDYDFGSRLINFLFGIMKVEKLFGQDVEITGWYRRGPSPYIQVHRIHMLTGAGKTFGNYKKAFWNIAGVFFILLGVGLIYITSLGLF